MKQAFAVKTTELLGLKHAASALLKLPQGCQRVCEFSRWRWHCELLPNVPPDYFKHIMLHLCKQIVPCDNKLMMLY